MDINETREAIERLSEEEKRALIVELIPQFVAQIREDGLLREQVLSVLREKTINQGQIILASATEKVAHAGQLIKEKLSV